jgi:parallel beta-helix repeat protein
MNEITNNHVRSIGGAGIAVADGLDNEIRGNSVVGCGIATASPWAAAKIIAAVAGAAAAAVTWWVLR